MSVLLWVDKGLKKMTKYFEDKIEYDKRYYYRLSALDKIVLVVAVLTALLTIWYYNR